MPHHQITRAAAAAAAVLTLVAAAATHAEIGECGAGPEPGEPGALFRLGGVEYGEAELSPGLQQALHEARLQHLERQRQIFDAAVMDIEIARRAAEAGVTKEVIARELLVVPPVSDAAVAAFYEANQAQIPYPLPAVQDRLRQMLAEQQFQRERLAMVQVVKAERGFEVVVPAPVAPFAEISTEGLPSKGNPDAPVTIVEFADYQCPHCREAAATIAGVMAHYGDAVRVVYMDFPVNRSGISRQVAEGAACADRQDRFWDYHDLAFANQASLGPESALQLARALELDLEGFEACLASPFPAERVAASESQAARLGLSGTPTIFVNGRRQQAGDLAADLPGAIDAALASVAETRP